ncbi:hypothetical protein BSR28_08530 [Boudabousia liubingyangii]|uniref:dihydrofolate reductase n=1 Tax=Boudabousia liubingyangii TaxID=1921764 RepID=UPI00093F6DC8|nr:dihydrofolate reductase [Boudabousia liubingyangii]OKL46094.1 hypothetical protein BSR28_08530 [Boudabousia liubingyangii]
MSDKQLNLGPEALDFTLGAIWAADTNALIGVDGDLPWHIPGDFKHFKNATLGCPIIMGRGCLESLPKAPLPGRLNIVLSRTLNLSEPNLVSVPTIEAVIELLNEHFAQLKAQAGSPAEGEGAPSNPYGVDAWVIGGAQVYEAFLPLTSIVVTSQVQTAVELKPEHTRVVHAPRVDQDLSTWQVLPDLSDQEVRDPLGPWPWQVVTYGRKM